MTRIIFFVFALSFSLLLVIDFATGDIGDENYTTKLPESETSEVTISESDESFSVIPTTPVVPLESLYEWTQDSDNEMTFKLEKDFSAISVTIVSANLADNSAIIIKSSGGQIPNNGLVYSNSMNTQKKMIFFAPSVHVKHIKKNDNDTFKVILESYGPITTTISPSTTTSLPWPTVQPGDSIYLTVNVSGRKLKEYTSAEIRQFQTCISDMANIYCDNERIKLTFAITADNVNIEDIRQCPYNWPQSDTCVQIKFQLPIIYVENDKYRGYELKSNHLFLMWTRNTNIGCLSQNKFGVYLEPDVKKSIAIWAIVIAFITVLFVVALWLIKSLGNKFRTFRIRKHGRMNRLSETLSYRSTKRASSMSMEPHYFQEPPKFFDN